MEDASKNIKKECIIGSDIINLDIIKQYAEFFEPSLNITNDIGVILIESLSEYLDELISVSIKMAKHRKGSYVQRKDVIEALKKHSAVALLEDLNDNWY